MPADDEQEEARGTLRQQLLEREFRDLRRSFCLELVRSLASVTSWLGFDAWLGGGDLPRASSSGEDADPDRMASFRAMAVVAEMASDLASGAVELFDEDRLFAGSALVRQLLETEYLLAAFSEDFAEGARWVRASPEEIRRTFGPKTMREVGGFSNTEYWRHCDMGGHPAPSGRRLLRIWSNAPGPEHGVVAATAWADLAQHLKRLWLSLDRMLVAEHARYESVRKDERARVQEATHRWETGDPLSATIGPLREPTCS